MATRITNRRAVSAPMILLLGLAAHAPAQWTDVADAFLRGAETNAKGVAWGDLDGDGRLDLVWSNDGAGMRVGRNDGGDVFVDVTSPDLLAPLDSNMPVLGDADNDGDLDLFLVNFGEPGVVFRNDDGFVFTRVLEISRDAHRGRSGSWVDYDGDGRLDLFESTNAVVPGVEADRLYRNLGDGRFLDVSPAALAVADVGRGHAWGDFDDDGDLDLFVGNGNGCPCNWESIPPAWLVRATNRLYRNDGAGRFTDVTAGAIACTNNARGVAAGDYDNDGDLDLFVVNLPISGMIPGPDNDIRIGGANQLLRNDGDLVFTDVTPAILEDALEMQRSAAWVDVDNDADLDLHVTGLEGNSRLFENLGGGRFDRIDGTAVTAGFSGRGAGWADYDGDGDLDAYVAYNSVLTNMLVRNDLANGNHWLEIELVGTASNRSAVGARAVVEAGGVVQVREVVTGSGYWSQHMLTLHFGLGTAAVADTVTVRWPSGAETVEEAVIADQKLVLVEPAPCPLDLTGDGIVGFEELVLVLSAWGPCRGCDVDVTGDGDIGFLDLVQVLSAWGPCR